MSTLFNGYDSYELQLDTPTTTTDFFSAARTVLTERFELMRDTLVSALAAAYLDSPERVAEADAVHREHLDCLAMYGDMTPLILGFRDLLYANQVPGRHPLNLGIHLAVAADVTRPETHALVWVWGRPDMYADALAGLATDRALGFSEYPYWSDAGRRERLTDHERRERQESWDRSFGCGPIADRALSWSVADVDDPEKFRFGGCYFEGTHRSRLEARWKEVEPTGGRRTYEEANETVLDVGAVPMPPTLET